MLQRSNIPRLGLATAGLYALAVLFSQLALRNLYRFLEFDPTFCAIFAQISDAQILPPVLLALFVAGVAVWAAAVLWRRSTIAAVLAGGLLGLVLLAFTVLFSRVNGIVFYDVISSLLPLLESGAL